MPGSLHNDGETLALNMLFRNTGAMPSPLYVGLATSAIADDTLFTGIVEEDDANYARQAITFTAPSDGGSGYMEIANDALIEFPAYAADADLPVTYAFVTDAQTGTTGQIISWMQLDQSKQPTAGEKLTIPIGNFVLAIN